METTALSQSTSALEIVPLPYPLGAEVRCGDLRSLDVADKTALKRAFLEHLVLLIRGQSFQPQDLLDFAKIFGEIARSAPDSEMPEGQKPRFDPRVSVVSNVVEDGLRLGSLGDGEVIWHSDHSYHEVPIAASTLFALEVPPSRGRTGFLNMYEALETLPADVRATIRDYTIKHDATYNSAGQIRRGMSPVIDVRDSPGPSHPVIRTHPETQQEALYLGRRPNAYINGLSIDASERMLNFLWGHATSRVAWYNDWKQGDVVIWDNRCVMHRREPFDPKERRVMYRAQTQGTKPVLDSAGSSRHSRHRMRVANAASV